MASSKVIVIQYGRPTGWNAAHDIDTLCTPIKASSHLEMVLVAQVKSRITVDIRKRKLIDMRETNEL